MAGGAGLMSSVIGSGASLVGGLLANNSLNSGYRDASGKLRSGIDTQQQGLSEAQSAYSPYTGLAASGASGLSNAINSRQMANQPQTSSYDVNNYMNPSAAYSTQQANNAIQSSALAHGGLGGGLAKALSNNANKMAMTNYNNAYQQMIDTNAQKFNQQQQQYTNANDYQQQQIGNRQNLAQLGLSGMNAGQQLQSNYRNNITNQYGNWANLAAENGQNKAGLAFNTANNIGQQLGSGAGSFMGGK